RKKVKTELVERLNGRGFPSGDAMRTTSSTLIPVLFIAVFINTKYSFKAPLPLGERVWGEGGVLHQNEDGYNLCFPDSV
ncbi:MAG: hypothetical protein ACPGVO_16870, partial [Spirulinaceae cyanobacterium]